MAVHSALRLGREGNSCSEACSLPVVFRTLLLLSLGWQLQLGIAAGLQPLQGHDLVQAGPEASRGWRGLGEADEPGTAHIAGLHARSAAAAAAAAASARKLQHSSGNERPRASETGTVAARRGRSLLLQQRGLCSETNDTEAGLGTSGSACTSRRECPDPPICHYASCMDGACVYSAFPDGVPCNLDPSQPSDWTNTCMAGVCGAHKGSDPGMPGNNEDSSDPPGVFSGADNSLPISLIGKSSPPPSPGATQAPQTGLPGAPGSDSSSAGPCGLSPGGGCGGALAQALRLGLRLGIGLAVVLLAGWHLAGAPLG